MSILSLQNITFTYFEDRKPTLEHLSAEFNSSRITVLTGASGCGKSTLLYLAAGIYPHHAGFLKEGSAEIDGTAAGSLAAPERAKLVGMMFQNPELQFCMDTVWNELVFCLENLNTAPQEMEPRIEEALAFCEISHLKNRTLQSLSGGERQKVMLACLALLKPRWLLLDEPFANIDTASAKAIAAKLRQLHESCGCGILAVDHRLEYWCGVADEVRVMENGLLGEPKPVEAELHYSPEVPPLSPEDQTAEPVLCISGLSLQHGSKQILSNISIAFQPGHIYAVLGESGCGKSSLFGALSGLYRYNGTISLEGHAYKPGGKKDLGKLGFVTQNPQDQFVADTVLQEIMTGLPADGSAAEKAEQILRSIKLWRYRDISAYMLSQGQQRRLGVAALMAYPCRVLICDEPTYAQDRGNTMAIMNSLCRQAREKYVALVFSTHDRCLAADYADEVWEMKGGTLCACTEPCL